MEKANVFPGLAFCRDVVHKAAALQEVDRVKIPSKHEAVADNLQWPQQLPSQLGQREYPRPQVDVLKISDKSTVTLDCTFNSRIGTRAIYCIGLDSRKARIEWARSRETTRDDHAAAIQAFANSVRAAIECEHPIVIHKNTAIFRVPSDQNEMPLAVADIDKRCHAVSARPGVDHELEICRVANPKRDRSQCIRGRRIRHNTRGRTFRCGSHPKRDRECLEMAATYKQRDVSAQNDILGESEFVGTYVIWESVQRSLANHVVRVTVQSKHIVL